MKLKGHFKKVQSLRPYHKKQIPRRVRKYFMTDKEFLTIYELFKNIKTEEDKVFWINLVETSKTYKHYKKSLISFYQDNGRDDNTVEKVLDFCKKVESVFKKDTEDKDTEEILQNEAEKNSFSGQETNDVSKTDKEQLEEKEAEDQKKNTPKQVKKNGEESKNKEEQAEKLVERFNSLSVAKDTLGNEDSSENDNVVSNEDNSETEDKQEEVNVEEVTEDAQQELQKESETSALEGEQDEKSVSGDTIKGE